MANGPRPGTRGRRGAFSLVELMVALALTFILGGLLVTTLRYGTRLWRGGNRRSHAFDLVSVIFHHIEVDVDAAKGQFWNRTADAHDIRVRFYVDRDQYELLNYGDPDPLLGRQRMRLVRGIPYDTLNPSLRQAGDGVSNDDDDNSGTIGDAGDLADEESYNLLDDDLDGRIDEDLASLEGLCEVGYMRGLTTADGDTLYRRVQAPIGLVTSLFDDSAPDPPDPEGDFDDNIDEPLEVTVREAVLAEGVLHFEVRCWSQYTTTWRLDTAFQPWRRGLPNPCGPTVTWDSDRLFDRGPIFAMDPSDAADAFFFRDSLDIDDDEDYVGPGDPSLRGVNDQDRDYVVDNVFPRAIMAVVVVEPPARMARESPTRLAVNIDDVVDQIPVIGGTPLYNERWPFLRIGDEWIEFSYYDPGTRAFVVSTGGRGVRNTLPATHAAGDAVRFGYTFSRVFNNPTARDL